MKRVVIIPDVHGRLFWKDVIGIRDCDIVFLGDYLDPYTGYEGITPEQALYNFKDILSFAKENNNVHLLYGNHDSYAFDSRELCGCRHDWVRYDEIVNLYRDNSSLFEMAYDCEINGKYFLLSHAGVHRLWAERHYDDLKDGNVKVTAEFLNGLLSNGDKMFLENMCEISDFRGGGFYVGSPLWCDVREHATFDEKSNAFKDGTVQIFGHTWVDNPISGKTFNYSYFCIDCQKLFYIDEEGNVKNFADNENL